MSAQDRILTNARAKGAYHRILGRMLFEQWFIEPNQWASMMQQLRSRIENNVSALYVDDGEPQETAPPPPVENYGIAIVPISGIIGKRLDWLEMMCGGCDLDTVCAAITEADEDADIHTIILWFDTWGGLYIGLPETAALIREVGTRKRVISFWDTKCTSAGAWLASQANESYCTRSAQAGSVGGFIAVVDTSKEWEQMGWALKLFKSGQNKALGLDGKPFEESEGEFLQARVQKQTGEFYADVRAGRPNLAPEVIETANLYDGDEALRVGLVDKNVRGIQEVIDAALAAHYLETAASL